MMSKSKYNPSFKEAPIYLGKEIVLSIPNGEKRKAQFAIVDLDTILASHNEENFSSTVGYPTNEAGDNINDRNYADDKSAQLAVINYAENLDPERIVTTSRTPSGTPIITTDGIVVSGNNRTMSLKLAAKNFPEKYQEYKKFLVEESAAFGFDQSEIVNVIAGIPVLDTNNSDQTFYGTKKYLTFKQPVLVRVDYDFPAYNTLEMSKFNKATQKSEKTIDKIIKLSNTLEASPQCGQVISNIIGQYDTASEFYAVTRSQRELSVALTNCSILTQQEMPAYFDGISFTNQGKDFLENLLAGMTLDKDGIIASNVNGVKTIRNIIVTSLPVLIQNATLKPGSLKVYVNAAVIFQSDLISSGLSFDDFINQTAMFREKYNIQAVYLNRLLNLGRNKFKESIEGYNKTVLESNSSIGMFGDGPTISETFDFYIKSKLDLSVQNQIINSEMVDQEYWSIKSNAETNKLTQIENALKSHNTIVNSAYWSEIKTSPAYLTALEILNNLLGFPEERQWNTDEAENTVYETVNEPDGVVIKLMQTPAGYWFYGYSINKKDTGYSVPANTYGPFLSRENAIKSFRDLLKVVLDKKFPTYNKAQAEARLRVLNRNLKIKIKLAQNGN